METKELWPRCTIELANGPVVICFTPRTCAIIEGESGLSSMEFAEKFASPEKVQFVNLGEKIILGAVRAVVPEMTSELLSERILPRTFLPIFETVVEKWAEAVGMLGPKIAKADKEDPTNGGGVSPSPTSSGSPASN